MSNHITMIIAKGLLNDKKKEALSRLKSRSKKLHQDKHAELFEAVQKEVKSIDLELWVLNNW